MAHEPACPDHPVRRERHACVRRRTRRRRTRRRFHFHTRADGRARTPAISVSASATADPTVGYQPRTTSIAGGDNRSIKEIPQSVAVVSSSVMQDQQARTLDDVLGNISGVTQTNTLGGTRDAFIKRGFGSNNDGSVLVDGVRTPVLHNYLATIDRVEVLKRPASLLYGMQDPGGVINLVTRKPKTPSAARSRPRARATAAAARRSILQAVGHPGRSRAARSRSG